MRRMENMFNQPFGPMGRGMLEDGGGRDRNRDRGRDRPSGSRELAPFDPGFGFGNMFQNMNQMMGNMMEGTERAFVSAFCPQGFRFTVGSGHCPMISKYGPSLSKAVGRMDPSFLVVKKSHFENIFILCSESTNSTKQKVHVGSQNSKTCLKQPFKKRQKTKDLNNK